ncbi:lectin [Streptomyces eurocidicus]|uniref:Outer membrane lipoprotein-sorting protein n=1 Tax=Streptomyces eurocidicus TaxID=66423 RepID=A0A7W8F445_STREU|nr:lectin [Streptomyces eurocidicus]MBB5121352.1 outer membrane lipoprotein-sorting protein [Streptomyces eurocidicus]
MGKRSAALLATAALAALTLAGQASAAPSDRTPAAAAQRIQASQTLYAPFALNHNESVSSNTATLVMQSDGNLVVYDEFGRARWASRTVGQGWTAQFQTDGNFVVYTRNGRAVWDSKTAGHPGSRLAVQDDGNVVIYDGSQAIWSTGTAH